MYKLWLCIIQGIVVALAADSIGLEGLTAGWWLFLLVANAILSMLTINIKWSD